MTIAAGNRHAGLGQPEFGSDHMHDALAAGRAVEKWDSGPLNVLFDRHEHLLGHPVHVGPGGPVRGDDVVDGGEGEVGVAHGQAALRQHLERLRTGDLVHQVQADE